MLTPERAFVCLTLFDIIRMPLAMLPLLIVYMIEVKYFQSNNRLTRMYATGKGFDRLVLQYARFHT